MPKKGVLPGFTEEQNKILDLILDNYTLRLKGVLMSATRKLEDKLWDRIEEGEKHISELEGKIERLELYVKLKSGIWTLVGGIFSAVCLLAWNMLKSG